jgi:hypothetical protein
MSYARNLAGWSMVAVLCIVAATDLTGARAEPSGGRACPEDCRYARHWGPALDPSLPFIEETTPPFCPLHSKRDRTPDR